MKGDSKMNAQGFTDEVLSSDLCPPDFTAKYQRFQEYQAKALDTLKEVHRICESNGIRYQLAYGSLLGAVRDGGQIPWDYDVDVFIPYEEKNKMVDCLKGDLSCNYYAWCPEIYKHCNQTLMRISPIGYHPDSIHVDVFYVMALPDNPEQQRAVLNNMDKLYHARTVKMASARRGARGSKRRTLRIIKEKIRYLPWPLKYAEKEYDRRCSLHKLEDTEYCAPATTNAKKQIFTTNKLWDTELVHLSTGTYRITKDYDAVLKQCYGEYMSIPSLNQRLKETMNALQRIDYYVEHFPNYVPE